MTEAVDVQVAAPAGLVALEVWGDVAAVEARLGSTLPPAGRAVEEDRWRVLWWEPRTWLIRFPAFDLEEALHQITVAVGEEGAAVDLSGGFVRHRLQGPGWRALLMVGGVFDAEAPIFGPGSVAGTVIHHLPVRLDVLCDDVVEAYVPPSYADDLLHHWRVAVPRLTRG